MVGRLGHSLILRDDSLVSPFPIYQTCKKSEDFVKCSNTRSVRHRKIYGVHRVLSEQLWGLERQQV